MIGQCIKLLLCCVLIGCTSSAHHFSGKAYTRDSDPGGNTPEQSGVPDDISFTPDFRNSLSEMAIEWSKCIDANSRRSTCIKMIDRGLIGNGGSMDAIERLFGDDFVYWDEQKDGTGYGYVHFLPKDKRNRQGWSIGTWYLLVDYKMEFKKGKSRRIIALYYLSDFNAMGPVSNE